MGAECKCGPSGGDFDLRGIKNKENGEDLESIRCYKCGKQATVRGRENSCRECFLNVMSKNFRSNLRTKCLEKKDCSKKMAILTNGSFASSSLLHLILSRNNDRHLKIEKGNLELKNGEFGPSFLKLTYSDDVELRLIVHVECPLEEGNFKSNYRELLDVVRSVFEKFTNRFGVEKVVESDSIMESMIGNVKVTGIKSCYFLHNEEGGESDECGGSCREFEERFKKLHSEDSDASLHIWRAIKMNNLKAYFKRSGINRIYLVTPETQDEVCKEVVFLTCLGLGERISWRSSFVDEVSVDGMVILRPLKTFSLKEVAFYHKFNGLPQLSGSNWFNSQSNTTISGCINSFTDELSSQHSNSFYNISKVVNRLVVTGSEGKLEVDNGCSGCVICQPGSTEQGEVCEGCKYFGLKRREEFEYFKKMMSEGKLCESKVEVAT